MTTPTPTPTTRRTFISRMLAAAGLAPLAAASYTLPKPGRTQAISCGQTEAYHSFDVGEHGPLEPVVVRGAAIKVPSNRWRTAIHTTPTRAFSHHAYHYEGDWNGAFKLEHGCTNPAYILADLYERTSAEPDWVVNDVGRVTTGQGEVVSYSARPKSTWGLDWLMLYRWGQFCDELVTPLTWHRMPVATPGQAAAMGYGPPPAAPRFTVETVCRTPEEMVALREELRMHCLSWQASDPRYRTSWPGIPYPVEGHA